MKTLYVDPNWLIDSFGYREFVKSDRNGPVYMETQEITKCRINHKSIFSQDSSEKKIVADGKVYCYASATNPFLEFKEQSKIIIDGKERTITKAKRFKEPMVDKVFSYELEFI